MAEVQNLQFTFADKLVFSFFTGLVLATDFNTVVTSVSLSLQHI
jgi:hypothetical protein